MKNKLFKNTIFFIVISLFIGSVSSGVETDHIQQTWSHKSNETTTDEYDYYTYQDMTNLFYDLEDSYPDIMSLNSIGKTYEGRNVWMVKLSDNVDEDENEPGVLLMGAHHGNEKPSFETLIFFIKHMVTYYGKENTDDDHDGNGDDADEQKVEQVDRYPPESGKLLIV